MTTRSIRDEETHATMWPVSIEASDFGLILWYLERNWRIKNAPKAYQ